MTAPFAFFVVAVAIFVSLMGSNVPAPLYDVYRREWKLSAFAMTAIFAAYPLTLVFALWGLGRISDRFGRRPVLVAAIVVGALASLVFALAQAPALLFAGRVGQAVGVALLSGAAAAALIELDSGGERRRAALFSNASFAFGSAFGPIASGLLVQYAPWPQVLPYLAQLALMVPLAVLLCSIPETAPAMTKATQWLPRKPALPHGNRLLFVTASIVSGLSWLYAALFIALVPSYLRELLHVHNLAVAGFVAGLMLLVSTIAQLRIRSTNDRGLMIWALVLLVTGSTCLLIAVPLGAVALIGVAALFCGIGHACGVAGGLATVNRIAPEATRGETISLSYSILFLTVALPILFVGATITRFGFFTGFLAFDLLAASVAIAVTVMLIVQSRRNRLREALLRQA